MLLIPPCPNTRQPFHARDRISPESWPHPRSPFLVISLRIIRGATSVPLTPASFFLRTFQSPFHAFYCGTVCIGLSGYHLPDLTLDILLTLFHDGPLLPFVSSCLPHIIRFLFLLPASVFPFSPGTLCCPDPGYPSSLPSILSNCKSALLPCLSFLSP